jgi:hypothetical protein
MTGGWSLYWRRFEQVEVKGEGAEKYDEADIGLRDRFAEFAHRRHWIRRR